MRGVRDGSRNNRRRSYPAFDAHVAGTRDLVRRAQADPVAVESLARRVVESLALPCRDHLSSGRRLTQSRTRTPLLAWDRIAIMSTARLQRSSTSRRSSHVPDTIHRSEFSQHRVSELVHLVEISDRRVHDQFIGPNRLERVHGCPNFVDVRPD